MDYGGTDRRRTKKDLKRKRIARGYKRGGQFRTMNVDEVGEGKDDSKKKGKKGKKKEKKY
jgi:hypothetical protein